LAGEDVGKAVKDGAVSFVSNVVGQVGASKIGELYYDGDLNFLTHKGAHFGLGLGLGALKGDALAGGIGAVVGETVAELAVGNTQEITARVIERADREGIDLRSPQIQSLINDELRSSMAWGKLGAVVATGLANRDVNVGLDVATNALENNHLLVQGLKVLAEVAKPVLVRTLGGGLAVLAGKGASDLVDEYQESAMDAHPEDAQWVDEGVTTEEAKARPLVTPMPDQIPTLEGYQPSDVRSFDEGYTAHDGVDTSILESLNIRPGQEWKSKIQGRAQGTGTPGHGLEALKAAIQGAKDPSSGAVYLDNGYHKALRKLGVDVKLQSNRRPDVLIVSKDGKSMQAIEIQSKSDREKILKQRNIHVGEQLVSEGIDVKVKVQKIPSWDYINKRPKQ